MLANDFIGLPVDGEFGGMEGADDVLNFDLQGGAAGRGLSGDGGGVAAGESVRGEKDEDGEEGCFHE